MFEDEAELRKTAGQIVGNMISANLAQKKTYTDNRPGKE